MFSQTLQKVKRVGGRMPSSCQSQHPPVLLSSLLWSSKCMCGAGWFVSQPSPGRSSNTDRITSCRQQQNLLWLKTWSYFDHRQSWRVLQPPVILSSGQWVPGRMKWNWCDFLQKMSLLIQFSVCLGMAEFNSQEALPATVAVTKPHIAGKGPMAGEAHEFAERG